MMQNDSSRGTTNQEDKNPQPKQLQQQDRLRILGGVFHWHNITYWLEADI